LFILTYLNNYGIILMTFEDDTRPEKDPQWISPHDKWRLYNHKQDACQPSTEKPSPENETCPLISLNLSLFLTERKPSEASGEHNQLSEDYSMCKGIFLQAIPREGSSVGFRPGLSA